MAGKIVISKRFRNNTVSVYQYLLTEFSAKTAFLFLEKLEQRIQLIIQHPTIGKPSQKKKDVRSIILSHITRYSTNTLMIL